jgi:glutamate--cysteine ligase catalytic subunit
MVGEPSALHIPSCLHDTYAQGSLETTATWIRNFVRSHPLYKFDSVVSQEINYDLLVAVDEM